MSNIRLLHKTLKKHNSMKSLIAGLRGRSVRLDACSMCQLKCPSCPTGQGRTATYEIGSGKLNPDDFKNFLGLNPDIKHVELSGWGEIFLNENLIEILKTGYEIGVLLTADTGVNLNTLTDEQAEALVVYGVESMTISIDGATQPTYEMYRVGGSFQKVLDNIQTINRYKQKHNSEYPVLKWQFIVFGHNHHEIDKAKRIAQNLDMDFTLKSNHTPEFSPLPDKLQAKYGRKKNDINPCIQLWTLPSVNWDGKVMGCCIQKKHHYGNAFKKSMKDILNSQEFMKTKEVAAGVRKTDKEHPCHECMR